MWPVNQMKTITIFNPISGSNCKHQIQIKSCPDFSLNTYIYYKLLLHHITKSCSIDDYGSKCTEKVIHYDSHLATVCQK